MTGNAVYVCKSKKDSSCELCGAVTEPVAKGQHAVVTCGDKDGIPGSYVKVAATNSDLQIAEIDIFSDGK